MLTGETNLVSNASRVSDTGGACGGWGSRRDLGMPVQGTPDRERLWATGGQVFMQPLAAGGGRNFERDFGW